MCESCKEENQVVNPCEKTTHSQVNTDDVFYNTECNTPQDLTNLNLPSGSNLSTILRKIDYKLGDNLNTVNFNAFNLEYLRTKYSITTIKTFSESVNLEFLYNKNQITAINSGITSLTTSLNSLSDEFADVKYPSITDTANIGFTVNDSINTVLQRIVNKFNSISGGTINSPSITAINTNSISLLASGTQNHTLSASVKISNNLNNKLQVLADGLYVPPQTAGLQTLAISGNQLSISNGNTVAIPVQGLQSLQLSGNSLTISGGNTITLPQTVETPLIANTSSSIQFTQSGTSGHTVTANVKTSSNVGNIISILTDGLYASVSALDTLNQINSDNSLKTILCNIVASCSGTTCYKWFVSNTSGTSVTISFTDSNNTVQSTSIAGTSTTTITGLKINTNPTSSLIITFLGKC